MLALHKDDFIALLKNNPPSAFSEEFKDDEEALKCIENNLKTDSISSQNKRTLNLTPLAESLQQSRLPSISRGSIASRGISTSDKNSRRKPMISRGSI